MVVAKTGEGAHTRTQDGQRGGRDGGGDRSGGGGWDFAPGGGDSSGGGEGGALQTHEPCIRLVYERMVIY